MAWLQEKINSGARILDIGMDVRRADRGGAFYRAEVAFLQRSGYVRRVHERRMVGSRLRVGEEVISYEAFVQRARESFAFLESELGYRCVAENTRAPEAWVKYESDTRRVIVHFEAGSGTWIDLAELQRSGTSLVIQREHNLERLLRKRALPVPADSLSTPERLDAFAEALKRFFGDFLRGAAPASPSPSEAR